MTAATVIVTVRNEAASLDGLLDSLLRGNRPPDEIVIADGGSTDGTVDRLRARAATEPRLRVLETPGNRSVGRNAAIRAARHDVIACTDAGVEVEPSWLAEILKPFEANAGVEVGAGVDGGAGTGVDVVAGAGVDGGAGTGMDVVAGAGVDVVAGFYRPIARTAFERAAGVVSAPQLQELNPDRFLPSTRSIAFRREAWRKAGGFDEALAHNEDTPFALALKAAGCRFAFAPLAVVGWHPRGDLRAFYRQHRRFGFGDGESRVQSWFYATIAVKYLAAAGCVLLGLIWPMTWVVLVAGVTLFVFQQAKRAWGRVGFAEALFLVPFLKVVYDVAYLSGYFRGRLAPPAASIPARL